ncbi:MAG: hypothetical protein GXX96_18735 [Planctomycetaceae bacterium]|nr:hypothetical protein [Planctomycetaceae bacterium]
MKLTFVTLAACVLIASPLSAAEPRVAFQDNPTDGEMHIVVDGQDALVYQYREGQDLVHFFPVRSPFGQSMTAQKAEPNPHHRSLWFVDMVKLDGGRPVNYYLALYSGSERSIDSKPPYKDHVRHLAFEAGKVEKDRAELTAQLIWECDGDRPVLDELRSMRVVALGEGQWLLDITFTLTASYGDLEFVSDERHYGWPYVRMNSTFSVEGGGTITSSEGGVNQAGTDGRNARWIDYVNTVDGKTSGLAIFAHPGTGPESPKWLTRDYGCFGPRRADEKSGKPFTLAKGESISQRVGILVHRGDTKAGKVADRYAAFVADDL